MAFALVAGFGGFPPRIDATRAAISPVFMTSKLASVCSVPSTEAVRVFFAAAFISDLSSGPPGWNEASSNIGAFRWESTRLFSLNLLSKRSGRRPSIVQSL
jgi:hypothetical protein